MAQETRTYRRSELYEEVWAEPVRVVAKRYGVSDVALSKTCRKLAVPLPGAGYWARIRAGHKARRPPLQPLPPGVFETLTVSLQPQKAKPELSPETSAAIAGILEPIAAIVVPTMLTNPHPLVVETQLRCSDAQPRGSKLRRLDIAVSQETLPRVLRILDALLKALEARGLSVEVTETRGPGPNGYMPSRTRVRIMDQWVAFRLLERVRGLALQIIDPNYPGLGRYEWIEGKRLRLEDRLNEFIAALYQKAEELKQRQQAYRESEEQDRRRLAAQRQAEENERRAAQFEDSIRRWRLAQDIREFCEQVRGMAGEAHCTIKPGGWVEELLTLGDAYAAKIDPLTPHAQELAGHVARHNAILAARGDSEVDPRLQSL